MASNRYRIYYRLNGVSDTKIATCESEKQAEAMILRAFPKAVIGYIELADRKRKA